MWLSLLFNKWTWLLLILGGLVLTIGVQRVELRHKDSKISALETTIGEFRASVAERDALITTQNGYVEAWKAAGIENSKRAEAAENRAKSLVLTARANSQRMLQEQIPQTCEGSIQWLRDTAPSLSW